MGSQWQFINMCQGSEAMIQAFLRQERLETLRQEVVVQARADDAAARTRVESKLG